MRYGITLLVLLSFFGRALCQNSKVAIIDSLLFACHKEGIFNGVALVADEGELILHKGYGVSNLQTQSQLSLSDRFYIGSLTKQFTSVLILQLQQQGLINIHSPVSAYLEEFEDSPWADITIYQLLTHTSGLGSYTSHANFNRSIPYSDEEMFAFIKQPLFFDPGTDWSYSNSGYFLLGKVAERVSRKEYGALLKENIFEPLRMNNTSFSLEWVADDVAYGYVRTVNGIEAMPIYSLHSLFSTGGIYSTAGDLYTWAQALEGSALLTEASKEILFEPFKNDYACGMYVKKGLDGDGNYFERHFHGGIINGYHSFLLVRVPEEQVVILLDNFYNQEIPSIKNRIWSALIGEELKPIKPHLSNLLFHAASKNNLISLIDSVSMNTRVFEAKYTFEEFDINKVAYRLMEAGRNQEASVLFAFNMNRYPESWNVYDSMGELQLKEGNLNFAKELYEKSLVLNPKNDSAAKALLLINSRSR